MARRVLVFVAVAALGAAGCSFDPSGASAAHDPIDPGRGFDAGAPRTPTPIDGTDAAPPDAAADQPDATPIACEDACPGGQCEDGTCVIACSGIGACAAEVVCPAGVPCKVTCSGPGSCAGGVDCSAATSCQLDCTGQDSCASELTCGEGRCGIRCSGTDSCDGGIDCSASCACDVDCSATAACDPFPVCAGVCYAVHGCTANGPCDQCE